LEIGFQSLNLAWLPRTDGVFLTDDPQKLVQQKKIANIPYITGKILYPAKIVDDLIHTGNCDDEGTLFSFSTSNIT